MAESGRNVTQQHATTRRCSHSHPKSPSEESSLEEVTKIFVANFQWFPAVAVFHSVSALLCSIYFRSSCRARFTFFEFFIFHV